LTDSLGQATDIEKPVDVSVVSLLGAQFSSISASFFVYIGETTVLLLRTLRFIARGAIDVKDLTQQMAAIGYYTVPIAILTTFTSAGVIALYFADFLKTYGAESFTGAVVALALGRELAPVLVGVVVAARAGSAIAAEIGSMKVTEQIDALRSLAVSPVQYLVVPRLLASLIMLPILCVVADAAGLVGGYVVSVWQGTPASSFSNSIHQFVEPRDFVMGVVKTVFFGLIIAIVSCHQGLETRGGATGVGRATTQSVVLSIVLIYIANFILAYLMFGGRSTI
jgi:phospholipid/cholesterol/gamma-HCH transport system permease protein